MDIPTLHTPHLVLRPWAPADADRLYEILQEPGIFQYFPRTDPPPRPWADKYIAHHLKQWQEHNCGHWAVVEEASERVVGWNGLEYLKELDEVEVAYLLSHEVWGKGFATEAARAAVQYGFETMKLPAIIGLVHPENAGSIRVLEKCGLAYVDQIHLWDADLLRYRAHAKDR
jgi:RimJ/RimL family protein N-acetyltransferase